MNFRIPAELKARLEAAATQNRRSITAELIARLESGFCVIVTDEVHRSEPSSTGRALELIEQLRGELIAFTATPKQ